MSTQLRLAHGISILSKAVASAVLLAAMVPLDALANDYSFTDSTSNVGALAHGTAYTWGLSPTANSSGSTLGSLETAVGSGQQKITSATLTITGLYDWTNEPDDVLYVNLLNNLKPGTAQYTYNSNPITKDTSYGADIFDAVTPPTPPTPPVAPTKPIKPTAPIKPEKPVEPSHPTNAQKAAYQAALTIYNAALVIYTGKEATYTTALAAYKTALTVYTTDEAAYVLAKKAYGTALTAYAAAEKTYTNYIKTQAALGFTGVTNQAGSLLVANGLPPGDPGTYTDPGTGGIHDATTITITFDASNIGLLTQFLDTDSSTTDLGLGFGPDCHFYDSGVSLNVITSRNLNPNGRVPDSGTTLAFLGLSVSALLVAGRRAKRRVAGA